MENIESAEKNNVGLDDLLISAIEKQPSEFQNAFNDLITQRITDRLEAAKKEIAANYFNYVDDNESEQAEEDSESAEEQDTTDEVEENGQDAETV